MSGSGTITIEHLGFEHVQAGLFLPWHLREQLSARSAVYMPLGTLELHCEHLPIGLDALTAHGICLRAAVKDGDIVLPPLHFGTGGDHGNYPWTEMMPSVSEIESQVMRTLSRFDAMGAKRCVIFSGHFAESQLDMIDHVAARWNVENSGVKVVATSVNRILGLTVPPDHAGIFETTLLYALHPNLVQLNRLPSIEDRPLSEGDVWAEGLHSPSHSIWGVIGADPRNFHPQAAAELLEKSVDWLAGHSHY
jgi:creatinine amidohydrolase